MRARTAYSLPEATQDRSVNIATSLMTCEWALTTRQRGASSCGHDALIPPSSLLNGLQLPPYTPVLDLEPRLRCRECGRRGKAIVSIKWSAGSRSRKQNAKIRSCCRPPLHREPVVRSWPECRQDPVCSSHVRRFPPASPI